MTNKLLSADNAITTLAAAFAAASTSAQVVSGGGALFPVLGAGQAFICTLVKSGTPTIREIILVQGHSSGSDNFTSIVRGLGGTTPLAWNAGDIVSMRPTAELLANFVQIPDAQASQYNFALDVGSANAYKAIVNPPLIARVVGQKIRWIAGHTNSGDSTFDDGFGPKPLVMPENVHLLGGDIVIGGYYESTWDGTYFQLSSHHFAFPQIGGLVNNGQVPSSAILQFEALLAISWSQLFGSSAVALPSNSTVNTQSIGDSSSKIASTAFVNPAFSFGGSANYRKNPDGSVDQWGLCNPNGGTLSVTFPIAFPNTCDSVIPGQISSGPTQAYIPPASVSRTGFQVANTGGQTYWQAKGH